MTRSGTVALTDVTGIPHIPVMSLGTVLEDKRVEMNRNHSLGPTHLPWGRAREKRH